ncbi:MAG: response regulator [Candidatus Dormibacteraeota bacterium]|nr:response regulator [Candidatus Dormibacteraeota bacterium]
MKDFDEAGAPRERAADDDVHVLFVEDDEAVAEMYRLKLELDGYSVNIAADGETAVDLAMKSPPDLIFLDVRLPHMDGFQVLEQLRSDERTRYVPVVILSNYGEDELVERGFRLGALEYLIKSQTTPSRVAGGVPGWVRSAMVEGR